MPSSGPADGSARCQQARADGSPCRGRPGSSGYCPFHDPARAEQQAQARRAGGRARSRPRPPPVTPAGATELPLENVRDVTALLGLSINEVRMGSLDAKLANAVGYLASVLLRAIQGGDLEERLAALEREAEKGRHRT